MLLLRDWLRSEPVKNFRFRRQQLFEILVLSKQMWQTDRY